MFRTQHAEIRHGRRMVVCAIVASVVAIATSAAGGEPVSSPANKASAPPPPVYDRTHLPMNPPVQPKITELDAHNVKAPPYFEVKAPAGAPNVVLVMIDDFGFGMPSTFGGLVDMPTADALAKGGLRYNKFHTAGICSPTRAALLTGRNSHTNNVGQLSTMNTPFRGQTGVRPQDITPLAEILRLNGYSTAMFGKMHNQPEPELSPVGPYDQWPTHSGFDTFYGFFGEVNHWQPVLFEGTKQVEPPHRKDYYLTDDLADRAATWIRTQHSVFPDRPFFLYFATGATHAPHHVPADWIARYKGRFDAGWDAYRKEVFRRQKAAGIVPPDTKLPPLPKELPRWESFSPDERRLLAREMETFAAFGSYTDHKIGEMLKALDETGERDNTLVIYILGDNGASVAGGPTGGVNEWSWINGAKEPLEWQLSHIDKWGGPETYPEIATSWGIAANAPFAFGKTLVQNYGATRNGMVISWPGHIKSGGSIRSQWLYATDIAPTILEAAGLPIPKTVNGVSERPMEGASFADSFADPKAPEHHRTQYFEVAGNRSIYHDGWFAGTSHWTYWRPQRPALKDDVWELYHVAKDFSQANDVAAKYPVKLAEMKRLFDTEAVKYSVYPIDDRLVEKLADNRRPGIMNNATSMTLYPGMPGLSIDAFISTMNRSFTISADVELPEKANGAILAVGGRFGGWTLYLKDGVPKFDYNYLEMEHYKVSGTEPVHARSAKLSFHFDYDGAERGSGGTGTILIDGKVVGEGRIEKTEKLLFGGPETADVGTDRQSPVTDDYGDSGPRFSGTIRRVKVEVK